MQARMVSTESLISQKLSIATGPARLEIDSSGRLVKEPTQDEVRTSLSFFVQCVNDRAAR